MDIRPLDLDDVTACGLWYTAMSAGAGADRVAPLVVSEEASVNSLRGNGTNPNYDRRAYAAWDGSTCLGTVLVELPRHENQHLAEIDVNVPPQYRRRGVGATLFDHGLALARAESRTTVNGEVNAPIGLTLEQSPGGRFALARGFVSQHIEEHLVLDVPVPSSRMTQLENAAKQRSAGYRVLSWVGLPPQEWLDPFAAMHTLMERDVPIGDLDREPIVYDADRITTTQHRLIDQGYGLVTTLILDEAHNPSAYTTVLVTEAAGEDVMQDDTFVLRAHRGRRLGTLAKAVNLRQLARHHGRARRVHTWTAHTNDAMRTVNERFGFHPVETMHEVELTLQPDPPTR